MEAKTANFKRFQGLGTVIPGETKVNTRSPVKRRNNTEVSK